MHPHSPHPKASAGSHQIVHAMLSHNLMHVLVSIYLVSCGDRRKERLGLRVTTREEFGVMEHPWWWKAGGQRNAFSYTKGLESGWLCGLELGHGKRGRQGQSLGTRVQARGTQPQSFQADEFVQGLPGHSDKSTNILSPLSGLEHQQFHTPPSLFT